MGAALAMGAAPAWADLACRGQEPAPWAFAAVGMHGEFLGGIPVTITRIDSPSMSLSVYHLASPAGVPTHRLILQRRACGYDDNSHSAILVGEKTVEAGCCAISPPTR